MANFRKIRGGVEVSNNGIILGVAHDLADGTLSSDHALAQLGYVEDKTTGALHAVGIPRAQELLTEQAEHAADQATRS